MPVCDSKPCDTVMDYYKMFRGGCRIVAVAFVVCVAMTTGYSRLLFDGIKEFLEL